MRPIVNIPEKDRATDIGNMHRKLVKITSAVPEICSRTDRQTDRQTGTQTDILITILRNRSRGRSNKSVTCYVWTVYHTHMWNILSDSVVHVHCSSEIACVNILYRACKLYFIATDAIYTFNGDIDHDFQENGWIGQQLVSVHCYLGRRYKMILKSKNKLNYARKWHQNPSDYIVDDHEIVLNSLWRILSEFDILLNTVAYPASIPVKRFKYLPISSECLWE